MKFTGYLDFYNELTEAIFRTYNLNEHGPERYHVKHRAFLLFKLTVFLDEARGNDYLSQLFTLKRTALSYLAKKHHLTIDEVKNFDIDRVLISLFFELQSYNLPGDIRNAIANSYPVGAEALQDVFNTNHMLGPFRSAEWIPDRFDELKSEGKRQLY
ncbi:TPA: hypothetical protein ACKP1B_001484 [Serratia fonticola]